MTGFTCVWAQSETMLTNDARRLMAFLLSSETFPSGFAGRDGRLAAHTQLLPARNNAVFARERAWDRRCSSPELSEDPRRNALATRPNRPLPLECSLERRSDSVRRTWPRFPASVA